MEKAWPGSSTRRSRLKLLHARIALTKQSASEYLLGSVHESGGSV